MNNRPSPVAAACVALALLALGFAVGYGFHTAQSVSLPANSNDVSPIASSTRTPSLRPDSSPPIVKGLHVSPNEKQVAFAAVYANGDKSSRFVLDLTTGKFQAREAPRGWQDFVVQWSRDGRSLLFDREKIPDAVADTTAGLHRENPFDGSSPRALVPPGTLPAGEKSFAGFWTSDGELIVKTRREPKSLFAVRNGQTQLIDRANVTYYQNRVVRENGRDVFYVVRDIPNRRGQNALFRTQNGQPRQISDNFGKISWAYVSEDARWLVVCRAQPDSTDWNWTLLRIAPRRATISSTRNVPSDVISVFWSPDGKRILGASGDNLWTVDIPSLQVKKIGDKDDWSADDAGWLPRENAILVASRGTLWKVDLKSGAARPFWKFPANYWN